MVFARRFDVLFEYPANVSGDTLFFISRNFVEELTLLLWMLNSFAVS